MEQLEQTPNIPLQQEREIDGKMDKKKFLQYVKKLVLRTTLISYENVVMGVSFEKKPPLNPTIPWGN